MRNMTDRDIYLLHKVQSYDCNAEAERVAECNCEIDWGDMAKWNASKKGSDGTNCWREWEYWAALQACSWKLTCWW